MGAKNAEIPGLMKNAKEVARMRALFQAGWSKRRIAGELGISRNTVERYLHDNPWQSEEHLPAQSKLEICLQWLAEQEKVSERDSEELRINLELERKVKVSRRTIQRAVKRLQEEGASSAVFDRPVHVRHKQHKDEEQISITISGWHIGPYLLTHEEGLSLANSCIHIAQRQLYILILLAQRANQLISREELASHLWQEASEAKKKLALVNVFIHRLRKVFARGPLGPDVIRNVYGKGYMLQAQVIPLYSSGQGDIPKKHGSVIIDQRSCHERACRWMTNPFYAEVHGYWETHDPARLIHQEYLLSKSIEHDLSFAQGRLELCYILLLQCFWGVRSSMEVLPKIMKQLEIIDQLPVAPAGWWGVKAEIMSLLLWQPGMIQQLYESWQIDTLPRGMPLLAWMRQLIFTGNTKKAIGYLQGYVTNDLCQGWLLLAIAHCANEDLQAAEDAVQKQLSIDSRLVGSRIFLAMLMTLRGRIDQAAKLALQLGIADYPLQGGGAMQGGQAIAAYSLSLGVYSQKAQELLDLAMNLINSNPGRIGAIGFWGLTALALDRQAEAIRLLNLSITYRCYSALILFATPFLKPYAQTRAYQWFHDRMQKEFICLP